MDRLSSGPHRRTAQGGWPGCLAILLLGVWLGWVAIGPELPVRAASASRPDPQPAVAVSPRAGLQPGSTPQSGPAPPRSPRARPVLVFLLPGVSWQEMVDPAVAAAWAWLARDAAIANLNTRTSSGYDPTAGYLTLGAGSRAYRVPATAGTAWQGSESFAGWPAAAWYQLWNGRAPGQAAVVYPGIGAIRSAHLQADHPVTIGLLATRLRQAGYPTAVVGNADLPEESWRPVALVGMDAAGEVPLGRVDAGLNQPDPTAPGGLRLDPVALAGAVITALHGSQASSRAPAGWVVAEWSDLERLQRSRDRFDPAVLVQLRRAELIRAGRWLAQWLPRFEAAAGGRLQTVVLSPYPSTQAASNGELLTPLLVYPQPRGWLVSATTRWPGVVANLDVAPSLWVQITGQPADLLTGSMGQAWSVQPKPDSQPGALWQQAARFARFEAAVSRLRPVVLRGYVLSLLVVFVVAILWLIVGAGHQTGSQGWRGGLRAAVLALAFGPLALLLASPLYIHGAALTLLAIWGVGLVAASLTLAGSRAGLQGILVVAAVTTVALLVDTFRGAPWMRASLLGYDPAVGARYYGIGNEYMGVLVGAGTFLWTALLDLPGSSAAGQSATARGGEERARRAWQRRWWGGVALATLLTAVVALPFWGANFGGGLTAAAAGVVAGLGIQEERHRQRRRGWGLSRASWGWTLAAIVLVVVVLAGIDALRPAASRSHLGTLVHRVGEDGGVVLLLQTIQRKLATNLKIMRYSIWTWGFALGLVVLFLFFLRPSPGFRRLLAHRPYLARGLMAATVASLVGFAVNDSGVVAAATSLIFPASALLLLALAPPASDRPARAEPPPEINRSGP